MESKLTGIRKFRNVGSGGVYGSYKNSNVVKMEWNVGKCNHSNSSDKVKKIEEIRHDSENKWFRVIMDSGRWTDVINPDELMFA